MPCGSVSGYSLSGIAAILVFARVEIIELLSRAMAAGASDLHLSSGLPPLVRVDGELRRLGEEPSAGGASPTAGACGSDGIPPVAGGVLPCKPIADREVRAMLAAVMSRRSRETFGNSLETDFAFAAEGIGRFRVNAYHHDRGAGAAFRVIPSRVPTMDELKLAPVFEEIAMAPRGLVLVTGPTGSGKSTTLAALIDGINRNRREHILSIEDPIEFVHASRSCLVTQREVLRDTRGFNAALRSALREDPDVILVGEMRDTETIRLALTAAETGHLVFGTLHTASAAKTVDRIVDAFPAGEKNMVRSALSESLHAVVSQTLLKATSGGRVAAHEVMLATPAIRNLIREDKTAQMVSVIQTGAAVGMQTLDQCLRGLVQQGTVSREAARAKARVPEDI